MKSNDLYWMGEALGLAAKGKGLTSPNPCVGAVLVRNQKIIGQGWHRAAGKPHAEVLAVRDARRKGFSLKGSTLYVTLEPCSTFGRTAPCTELIIREKIKRVVVGGVDLNPAHAGHGLELLRSAKIEVRVGVLSEESFFLNRDFNHWIAHRTPWVTLKSAMSYDGRITRPEGESRWLTSVEARQKVQELRGEADAILVGGETARRDNPRLTVRNSKFKAKLTPWRVVMSRSGKIPRTHHLRSDEHRDRTLIYRGEKLSEILKDLGSRGVMNLWVEGGGEIHSLFIKEERVHEVALFWAPMITGTDRLGFSFSEQRKILKSVHFSPWRTEVLGGTVFVRALVNNET